MWWCETNNTAGGESTAPTARADGRVGVGGREGGTGGGAMIYGACGGSTSTFDSIRSVGCACGAGCFWLIVVAVVVRNESNRRSENQKLRHARVYIPGTVRLGGGAWLPIIINKTTERAVGRSNLRHARVLPSGVGSGAGSLVYLSWCITELAVGNPSTVCRTCEALSVGACVRACTCLLLS